MPPGTCSRSPPSVTGPALAAQPAIIAYVFPQERIIAPSEIAAGRLTHINYAFADIKDGRVVEGFAHDAENFKALTGLRREHPQLKLMVSVGGWTGPAAQAAYLWNAEKRTFVSYDDPESLGGKCRYIRERGLGGAMFWEYYADPSGALLGTLASELRGK